jgi:tripartite-type tricarboxylate transporter receptor subunit TctC
MACIAPFSRRRLLAGAALLPLTLHAQTPPSFPSRPIRLVVSFAAGGAADFLARTVAQKLSEKYGQPVVVDNRPGASGTIGAEAVFRSPPDGHTILVTNQLIVQAPNLIAKLAYDPLRDFSPVADLGGAPIILAVNAAATPARTLQEFIAEAKQKPRTFSYASVGIASMGHLYGAQLNAAAGIDLMHVPYKGSGPVVQALVGGEVQSAFTDFPTMKPHVESGRLRMLAVSRPYPAVPNLPTFASQGIQGLESYSWIGMFVPSATPQAITRQLAADIGALLRTPDVAAKVAQTGLEAGGMPIEQFTTMVREDHVRWASIMKTAGIKPE